MLFFCGVHTGENGEVFLPLCRLCELGLSILRILKPDGKILGPHNKSSIQGEVDESGFLWAVCRSS